MSRPEAKIAKSKDGTLLAYDVYGSGPALVFITGAICHRRFKPVIDDAKAFAREYTVYCYDRRGRGDSGDTQPYAPEREVEDVEAIIDATGGSAFVYGHSSGAVLALEAARAVPNKVRRVVMYEAPYAPTEEEREKNYRFVEALSAELRRSYSGAIRLFLTNIGMRRVFTYLLPLMPGWSRTRSLAPTLIYDMILTRDLPPVDRLAGLKTPTLILYGAKSTYDFASTAKQVAASLADARVEEVPGQDHMVSPKVLLPYFTKFFGTFGA